MKRHGIWNPIMLSIRFGFVPGMIAYLAVHDGVIGIGGWMTLIGASLLSFSRGFWNSVSDTAEDRAEEIVTPSVRYGPRAAMRNRGRQPRAGVRPDRRRSVAAARAGITPSSASPALRCDRLPLVAAAPSRRRTIPPSPF